MLLASRDASEAATGEGGEAEVVLCPPTGDPHRPPQVCLVSPWGGGGSVCHHVVPTGIPSLRVCVCGGGTTKAEFHGMTGMGGS